MIQRAIDAGVSRFFIPAIDSTYTEAMLQLEKDFPEHVFLMMGLHPTSVKENYKEELAHVEALLPNVLLCHWRNWHRFVLGYIHFRDSKEAFKHQIQLAKKYKLPIVIHCRDAFDEIFEVLEEEKSDDLFGIFHCFTGTLEQAKQAISYNMKLGIGGVVTFKNGKIDQFLIK